MLDFGEIAVDKCLGRYSKFCCLSADDMIELLHVLRNAADDAEIIRFHRFVCTCNTPGGGGQNPVNTCVPGTPGCSTPETPTPSQCTGNNCGCTDALKAACADSSFRYKLYGAATALTAALVPLTAMAASPVALAALSTVKDYGDAVRGLAEVCIAGSATKDDITDFCSQRAAAIAVVDKLPGGVGMKILSPLESLLSSITSTCCKDFDKPVPIEEHSGSSKTGSKPSCPNCSIRTGNEKKVISESSHQKLVSRRLLKKVI